MKRLRNMKAYFEKNNKKFVSNLDTCQSRLDEWWIIFSEVSCNEELRKEKEHTMASFIVRCITELENINMTIYYF